ncbi:E3 ubiquitin-protein ligase SINA-like 10 isoform X1 [Oryza brachyantha]|uniref:E3 ubiquitin-protein ligase SINA-like 10 isoform X1 n=1 Tax=Oryza brachyantha TaxID=4533 RepID=UPI001ADA78BF|nr:E3 ubiquitin-protein ligase SINA-like 10 isoform X1 [Oryza brachyantha]
MAKFTFDDADEDPPVASGAEKRKRDAGDDPVDGEAPRPRNSAVAAGSEQAVPGEGLADGEVEGAGLNVQIDPDVLDCSICFDSLRPPLYQCQNGHVACSACWSKLNNKCHVCSRDANFARNIALEKIVESIKSSCSYAKWGCCKFINYAQRDTHEESCPFAPSVCPIYGCGYNGFTGHWSQHFLSRHRSEVLRFIYSQPFNVNLEVSVPFLALLGEDDHLFLLLNNSMMPFGHALSVVCLRTGNLNWKFSYEIEATSRKKPENRLQLKASVSNTKHWTGLYPAEAFLLVPCDFCNSSNIVLNISIERCDVV